MNDGPEWFAPKALGFGSGRPIAWQGWAVLAAYLAILAGLAHAYAEHLAIFLPLTAFATFLLLLIAAKTTRGGWKWRGWPRRRD
ncbi:hypothetical protein H8M03_09115 [Sphingomonas sabuli]|uniref:DUF4175 domain-containing protein n=1 Tax=Sphingomonas sabuli TaxID=2764186 RepID=A0A7G9L0N1_9SPHN|nr:hypothetical protein [Sphingomonas sabuli]QNM82180.1 hypothetical protein H8M03_09115 [Sphingomonas sabuli]